MDAKSRGIKLSDSETIEEFQAVKDDLGLKNDTEVLRFLVRWYKKKELKKGGE